MKESALHCQWHVLRYMTLSAAVMGRPMAMRVKLEAAGVTIADQGACDDGCRINDGCADDEYCIKRVGDCEGRGVCTEMPNVCTAEAI